MCPKRKVINGYRRRLSFELDKRSVDSMAMMISQIREGIQAFRVLLAPGLEAGFTKADIGDSRFCS
jgi:hypothetical protein